MLGANTGRRKKPWKASGSSAVPRFSSFGPRFVLGPAQVEQGIILPQTTLFLQPGSARCTISLSRFSAEGSHYLGAITGGQSEGAIRITRVRPRYVLQGGGSALAAASGAPTIGLGTAAGSTNLIAPTAIGSIASVSSPVDGQAANEVSVASGLDADIRLTIAGGSIVPNTAAYLIVDIDYTVLM